MCPYKREHQHSQPDTAYRQINQLIAIGEESRYGMREKLTNHEPAARNHYPGDNPQSQRLFHPVYLLCAEVVPHDWLHSHSQPQNNHYIKRQQPIDDAIRADSHIAPIVLQTVIDDNHDGTRTHIHQEWRHTDGEDTFYNPRFHFPDIPFKMHRTVFLGEVAHHPHHTNQLRDNRCRSRTPHSPFEVEDKDRSEDDVSHHRYH